MALNLKGPCWLSCCRLYIHIRLSRQSSPTRYYDVGNTVASSQCDISIGSCQIKMHNKRGRNKKSRKLGGGKWRHNLPTHNNVWYHLLSAQRHPEVVVRAEWGTERMKVILHPWVILRTEWGTENTKVVLRSIGSRAPIVQQPQMQARIAWLDQTTPVRPTSSPWCWCQTIKGNSRVWYTHWNVSGVNWSPVGTGGAALSCWKLASCCGKEILTKGCWWLARTFT